MTSLEVKRIRCADTLSFLMGSGHCVFFTLTTPDVCDIHDIRLRWRRLRNWLVRWLGENTFYVMNFERHPKGHGWHIHSVFNKRIDLNSCLWKIRSFGFGRVDVRHVTSTEVSDYLTKHCLKAYRGVSRRERECDPFFRLRLVNCSRGLPRLADYINQSEHLDYVRSLMQPHIPSNLINGISLAQAHKEGLFKDIQCVRLSTVFFRRLHSLAEIGAVMAFKSIEEASIWVDMVRRL